MRIKLINNEFLYFIAKKLVEDLSWETIFENKKGDVSQKFTLYCNISYNCILVDKKIGFFLKYILQYTYM